MDSTTRRDFVRHSVMTGAAVAAASGPSLLAQGTETSTGNNKIKIIAISCSPRKGQTTATSLKVCLEGAKEVNPAIETELIELAELRIPGYPAVGIELAPGEKDDFPPLVPKLKAPEVRGIIIGTPVYFGNMSFLCKAFLDRCMAFYKDNHALGDKVGGVLAIGGSRNGGQEATIQSVQMSMMCQEMIVVGNGHPSSRIGATVWSGIEGGVTKDEFGLTTAKNLGRHVAETALRQ